jgi:hypothetical protein
MASKQEKATQKPSWMALLDFAFNYQRILRKEAEEGAEEDIKESVAQEKEKHRLGQLIILIAALRAFLAMRSGVSRTYNYHKEEYGAPEEPVISTMADASPEHGHENIDAPMAGTSLFYLPLLLMQLCVLIANRKTVIQDQQQINKFIFELSDSAVWSAVHTLRLEGRWISELDAREWAGNWADTTSTSGQSILLTAYGLELIYQVCYDWTRYQKNAADLIEVDELIAGTDDPFKVLQLQAHKTELLRKKTQLIVLIAADALQLSCMVIGIALSMAMTAPVGFLLMVIATAANQLKNLVVSIDDYIHSVTKCYTKSACLDELAAMDLTTATVPELEAMNTKLATLGMPHLMSFSEYERKFYLQEQRAKINTEMKSANKHLVLNVTWYGFILTTIGFLAFGNPVGFGALVLGLAAYGVLKTGFFIRDKLSTQNPLLTSYSGKNDSSSSSSSPSSSPAFPHFLLDK